LLREWQPVMKWSSEPTEIKDTNNRLEEIILTKLVPGQTFSFAGMLETTFPFSFPLRSNLGAATLQLIKTAYVKSLCCCL